MKFFFENWKKSGRNYNNAALDKFLKQIFGKPEVGQGSLQHERWSSL